MKDKKNQLLSHPLSFNEPQIILQPIIHSFSKGNQAFASQLPKARLKLRFSTIWYRKQHYFSIFKDVFACMDVYRLETLLLVGLVMGKEMKFPTINGAQTKNLFPQ